MDRGAGMGWSAVAAIRETAEDTNSPLAAGTDRLPRRRSIDRKQSNMTDLRRSSRLG